MVGIDSIVGIDAIERNRFFVAGGAYLKACVNGGGIGYRHFDAISFR